MKNFRNFNGGKYKLSNICRIWDRWRHHNTKTDAARQTVTIINQESEEVIVAHITLYISFKEPDNELANEHNAENYNHENYGQLLIILFINFYSVPLNYRSYSRMKWKYTKRNEKIFELKKFKLQEFNLWKLEYRRTVSHSVGRVSLYISKLLYTDIPSCY